MFPKIFCSVLKIFWWPLLGKLKWHRRRTGKLSAAATINKSQWRRCQQVVWTATRKVFLLQTKLVSSFTWYGLQNIIAFNVPNKRGLTVVAVVKRYADGMDGDLEGTGDGPPKIWGGDGPCIRPPIFREVVLLDAWQSTNWLKKRRCNGGIFCSEIEVFREDIYAIYRI